MQINNQDTPTRTVIGFLGFREFENGEAYRGAILVTDEASKPLEFRCTAPVRPTQLQRTLYGKADDLRVHYPQFSIRMARFRGVNRLPDFSDNRQYWGHAFDLLRRGEQFLLDHVPIPGRVVPGKMIREDRPWYPSRATREAIANALCHRDYSIPGGTVAVAMYDDHLEVTNPGKFHFGLKPDDMTKPHPSKPWNPLIASVFYRAGVIEQWGSDTLNILG